MSTTRIRRPGRPGYDVEQVLAVAVEVFNERGYDGTSMGDVARRLGISKSAIYHHVNSKEALLEMALERAHAGLLAVADEVRTLDAPAVARLERLIRGSVLVLVDQLPYVTLLLRVRGNTDVERRALARRRSLDRLAADLVAEAVAAGDLREDLDRGITARLLFGLVNSLIEWYRPGRGRSPEALSDAVIALLFEGLRRRRAPSGSNERP